MTSREIRQKFLSFQVKKRHAIIPSASLIPVNDPTVLFTTAGMHPLVPFLLGEIHPSGKRLASVQKCVRTNDIEEVGDPTHHTFFEMLGNWSLGDYFKKEAIEMSWEFLTSPDWLNLDKSRLAVSVFMGDENAPFDEEAFNLWRKMGIPETKIAKLPKEKNWWGPAGETGPCGPDTEMFYWVGDPNEIPESFNDDNNLWVEIWNDVFMEYNKKAEGRYELLEQKNVDTGMGLERILAVVNGLSDNYKTELFLPIIGKIEELSGKKYGESEKITRCMRIIADHLKAAAFIMGDDADVSPSNVGRGYIVRRLIRRAIRYGRQIGITETGWTKSVVPAIQEIYDGIYPELQGNGEFISSELVKEEERFMKTLENGMKEFSRLAENGVVSGHDAFNLYQSYGLPKEDIKELSAERGIEFDESSFDEEFKRHQEFSRTASAGMFKGGLADASEKTTKLHTAAHLTLAALRKVLGDHVSQKGSNITTERLRFDFSHPVKMTPEEIKKTENMVNDWISSGADVSVEEMDISEAKNAGATGVFGDRYGEKVKVYSIGEHGEISKEICGGPHVSNIGTLGRFKIIKEESASAGIRRIKAVLE
ncbi:MAG: alanine--tRNA ligase [Parcubacteria group bacterium]